MARLLVSLGANIGDREGNLRRALAHLGELGIEPLRLSAVYETEPVGDAAGPVWFLNAAVAAATVLSPREALEACQAVERRGGRDRDVAGGARTIDVDLLAWDDAVIEQEGLSIPHPRMHLRRFVLAPLAEVAAEWRHPIEGKTVAELLAAVEDTSTVRRIGELKMEVA